MSTSTEPSTTTSDEKPPLQLEMKVEKPEDCICEVLVTISQDEVKRYLKDAYDELVPEAQVPGFRAGRAPRGLVEKQFKDRVVEQVKGSLLMDSLAQVTETDQFSAIGEPNFDYEAIKIPDEGDFKYQFKVEVRPEFELPNWKGLKISKPVEKITEEDIDESLKRVLSRYATLEATDEPARLRDKLLITATFSLNGKRLSEMEEEQVDLEDQISFSDAVCDSFGKEMTGIKEGETRKVKVKIADGIEDTEMQGAEVDAEFHAVEVLKHEFPKLDGDFLEELGDFESNEELRDFIRDSLDRQANYRTQQAVRLSVVGQLLKGLDFALPKALVNNQVNRELQRKMIELQSSGFDDDMIRGYLNAARHNALTTTESALREHFVLEELAEQEKIEATEEEFDSEIELIAEQEDLPPRRVRARMEKQGQMDALRNQIIERKVIERIVEDAKVTEEPVDKKAGEEPSEFAVHHSVLAIKDTSVIPEAMYNEESSPLDQTKPTKEKAGDED